MENRTSDCAENLIDRSSPGNKQSIKFSVLTDVRFCRFEILNLALIHLHHKKIPGTSPVYGTDYGSERERIHLNVGCCEQIRFLCRWQWLCQGRKACHGRMTWRLNDSYVPTRSGMAPLLTMSWNLKTNRWHLVLSRSFIREKNSIE